jgi:hypothetical protein
MGFPFDNPGNILQDIWNGRCCVHVGTNAREIAVERLGDRTRSKSNKGSKNGQLFMFFAPRDFAAGLEST